MMRPTYRKLNPKCKCKELISDKPRRKNRQNRNLNKCHRRIAARYSRELFLFAANVGEPTPTESGNRLTGYDIN
jgi:hypothetical protein